MQSTPLNLNYSSRVATRMWGPDDPAGAYVAYIVLTRPGLSLLVPANWLGIGTATLTVGP